jgi:uncharacterized protein
MPSPVRTPDTDGFWSGCGEHRLLVQRCASCGNYRHPPSPVCFECRSLECIWVESAGAGEVYTWTVTHHMFGPLSPASLPYNAAVVRLFDCGGALVTTNLVGVDTDAITAGMTVRVQWCDLDDGSALPLFTPTNLSIPDGT